MAAGVHRLVRDDWQTHLGGLLEAVMPRDGRLLVWGAEAFIYFAAGRPPCTRSIYYYPVLSNDAGANTMLGAASLGCANTSCRHRGSRAGRPR